MPQRKGKLTNLKRESTGAQEIGDKRKCVEGGREGLGLPAGRQGLEIGD